MLQMIMCRAEFEPKICEFELPYTVRLLEMAVQFQYGDSNFCLLFGFVVVEKHFYWGTSLLPSFYPSLSPSAINIRHPSSISR
jgi:hypothetical protein